MTNKQKEYRNKYGNVPSGMGDRIIYAMDKLKLNIGDISKIKKFVNDILFLTEWKTYDFTFYFIPEGAPRPKYSGKIGSFYVKGAKADARMFSEYLDELKEYEVEYEMITTPCKFYCDIFMPVPENMSRIEKFLSEIRLTYPLGTPDWDNVGKKYSDMVQHGLILNDSLIVDGRVRKYYSFKPRVEIHIEYLTKYDCNHNKKKVESWKSYTDSEIKVRDSII